MSLMTFIQSKTEMVIRFFIYIFLQINERKTGQKIIVVRCCIALEKNFKKWFLCRLDT